MIRPIILLSEAVQPSLWRIAAILAQPGMGQLGFGSSRLNSVFEGAGPVLSGFRCRPACTGLGGTDRVTLETPTALPASSGLHRNAIFAVPATAPGNLIASIP